MNLAANWKTFLASRVTNAEGNCKQAAYLSSWNPDTTVDVKLQLLTNDPTMAVFAHDGGETITTLHSFKNLVGTILNPFDKFTCLIGGNRVAPVVIVNEVVLPANCHLNTPPPTSKRHPSLRVHR